MKVVQGIFFWLSVVSALLFLVAAFLLGGNVPIADQVPILNLLVTISSIVFGLMGVWLAVIYAESLKTIFDTELKAIEKKDSIKNFKYLSKPMIVSAAIITYVLLINVLHPLLITVDMLLEFTDIIRRVAFTVLTLFMLAQIWTIIYIFAPAENIKNKAEHHVSKQGRHERLTKNTRTAKKSD